MKHTNYLILSLILLVSSCTTIDSVFKTSPYKAYAKSLKTTKLDDTQLGKTWLDAGKNAVDSLTKDIKLPFKSEIFFRKESPAAVGYRINYPKSAELTFKITSQSDDSSGVFINIIQPNAFTENVIDVFTADTTFVFKANEDTQLTLRVQPRLLENHYVIIEVFEKPKLGFPVQGGVNRDIQSFWGATRGGGSRTHEGVDIFNKRGTPVVAVEDGVISRVQLTNLGGKVVWQRLGLMGQSIYYAHLDSQLVSVGQSVKRGEPIGLMGNTGNARTTSPHLHFGIYTSGGAIDPLPYIATKDTIPGKLVLDKKYVGEEVLIKSETNVLPVNILATSTNSIRLLDAFGNAQDTEKVTFNKQSIRFKPKPTAEFIVEKPSINSVPISRFENAKNYKTLGFTEGFVYVEQNGLKGWVERE